MMVIFVSQCEKKALKRTRRVLDAFADRIGDNTWQTVITEEGLQAVKKLLRQTASKNTAVSCHWIRSRARSDLLWVVGKREKFDYRGVVPVNYTERDINIFQDNYEWQTLPLITYAAMIAALFHDAGKATLAFQDKINPESQTKGYEPYRHEWISLRIFEAFVLSCDTKDDSAWLTKLADEDFDNIKDCIRDDKNPDNKNPLLNLSPFAQLVGWLILSHHRLPVFSDRNNSPDFADIEHWFDTRLSALWNSPKCQSAEETERLDDNWRFLKLPYKSRKWAAFTCTKISEGKDKILQLIDKQKNILHDDLFTSHLSRLALMLADHHVSAFSIDKSEQELGKWRDKKYCIYANTGWQDDKRVHNQRLDQHLIGVSCAAEKICQAFPKFKQSLPSLTSNELLEHIVSKKEIKEKKKLKDFKWQNDVIKTSEKIADKTLQYGFFGINMASTGKGKTRANAKIMYALGKATGQIRFNVALGLRTLTLQTGKEFQEDLDIDKKDISIAVGGIAVKELFARNQRNEKKDDEQLSTGSDSADDVLNSEFLTEYDGTIDEDSHSLFQWTTKHHNRNKHRINKLILPPVLVCTIDHLIPATEGIRGGQQIAPMLRLLGSDLILDEPDDFNLSDLPALCRLVHWTGLLGRRVLLSTATMPPALVYACFEAYKAGWSHYAKANLANWDGNIQCAWFDEFNAKEDLLNDFSIFKDEHGNFVENRVKQLNDVPAKRKGKIVTIEGKKEQTVYQNMADTIFNSIKELHKNHYVSEGEKHVSIGLVRMANIDPMIAVAKNLLAMDAPENTQIHYCVYHSRFPLAIRSHIEEKLDYILKRKNEYKDRLWENEKGIGGVVNNSKVNNHIFVVLASPVAEVGRDHDYDWAVVEPSSMRSIVQIAGRVLRHRDIYPDSPNIHLLNKNIKVLKGEKLKGEKLKGENVCFEKPGFESKNELKLLLDKSDGKDLHDWLSESEIKIINANPKIKFPDKKTVIETREYDKFNKLNELEHQAIIKQLFGQYKNEQHKVNNESKFVRSAKPWWKENIHWSGELQLQQKFRESEGRDIVLCRYLESEIHPIKWKEKINKKTAHEHDRLESLESVDITPENAINYGSNVDFWYSLDEEKIYLELLTTLENYENLSAVSRRFGELIAPVYKNKNTNKQYFNYHIQLGLYRVTDEGK